MGGPSIVCRCSSTCTDGVPSVSRARTMRVSWPPKSHRSVNCRPPIVGRRGMLCPRWNSSGKRCVSALSARGGNQSPCEYKQNSDQSIHGLKSAGALRAQSSSPVAYLQVGKAKTRLLLGGTQLCRARGRGRNHRKVNSLPRNKKCRVARTSLGYS